MAELRHSTDVPGLAPGNGYSHAVSGTGRFVAVSGQVPLDETGALVGEGDPEAQVRQVFDNLHRALTAAGASFGDVVKLTYYVTDIGLLPVVRTVRDEHLDPARLPASSAVQVVALFRPGIVVEIEALAIC